MFCVLCCEMFIFYLKMDQYAFDARATFLQGPENEVEVWTPTAKSCIGHGTELNFKIWRNLPAQLNPSPVYPGKQVHVELPGVLMQVATALHAPLFTAHSSISTSSYVKLWMKHSNELRQVMWCARKLDILPLAAILGCHRHICKGSLGVQLGGLNPNWG